MYAIMYKAKEKPLDHTIQRRAHSSAEFQNPNHTGFPRQLKSGVEDWSGYSMNVARVHYNYSKPAQLDASAYTRGTEIHVAPRQERHLPHKAWHVVQQMEGRVRPTKQMKNVAVNDNISLEQEVHTIQCKRAVLGRRIEPYRVDIEQFINLSSAQRNNYLNKLILGTARDYTKNDYKGERVQKQNGVAYVDKEQDDVYKSSVNAWIKEKIFVKADAAWDYRRRVLDADNWSIEKNRTWIKEGETGGANNYNSNLGINDNDKKYGMKNNGQFRLVGVNALLSNGNVFQKNIGDECKYEKNRTVTFYTLKTDSFGDYIWNHKGNKYSCPQSKMYEKAFERDTQTSNFIAQVVKHASNISLLCGNKIPNDVRETQFECKKNDRFNVCRWPFKNKDAVFPTVLAQEMEQLRDGGYEFAEVTSSDGKSKVISLPHLAAERVRSEAVQREAAQREAAQRNESQGEAVQKEAQREAARREETQIEVALEEAAPAAALHNLDSSS